MSTSHYTYMMVALCRPECSRPKFRSELTSLLDNLQTNPQYLIIMGDFNIHIDNATDSFSKSFADILSSGNLKEHVNGSTHRFGHTLDLAISRHNKQLVQNVDVLTRFAGDHSPLLCTLRQPAPSKLRKTVRQRKLKNIDINCFTDDVKTPELITSPRSDLQDAVQQYNDVLSGLLDLQCKGKTTSTGEEMTQGSTGNTQTAV